MEKKTNEAEQWQSRITGEWYGTPSVFAADGQHLGLIKVNRSSVTANGQTTYYMDTKIASTSLFQGRFAAPGFAFGVRDMGAHRVYVGPDFYGAGTPYGSVVDAHYYSPAWSADLRTLVHILPDGVTQVYSSQLFEGPKLVAVFNGLYLMSQSYHEDASEKGRIDAFLAREKAEGNTQHILPMKTEGQYHGEFTVHDGAQKLLGKSLVKVDYQPKDLRRADIVVSMEGVFNQRWRYSRCREGQRHDVHGPDLFGNGISFGRAFYASLHAEGQALKLKTRDFLIDDNNSLSCVWQVFAGDQPTHMLYGVLRWTPKSEVIQARY